MSDLSLTGYYCQLRTGEDYDIEHSDFDERDFIHEDHDRTFANLFRSREEAEAHLPAFLNETMVEMASDAAEDSDGECTPTFTWERVDHSTQPHLTRYNSGFWVRILEDGELRTEGRVCVRGLSFSFR